MFHLQPFAVLLLAIVSAFSVQAQSNTTTCQTAPVMPNVNATLLAGNWYEEIRAPAKNVSCVLVNVDVVNNQTQLNVTTYFSPTSNGLMMNKYEQVLVNISEVGNNNGIVASNNNISATYKILSTDYTTNVVLCGYTNKTDPTTSFGIIFTRDQIVPTPWLMQLKSNASQIIPSFNDSTTGIITQSKSCKANSASTSVPVLATLFAAFFALLKLTY